MGRCGEEYNNNMYSKSNDFRQIIHRCRYFHTELRRALRKTFTILRFYSAIKFKRAALCLLAAKNFARMKKFLEPWRKYRSVSQQRGHKKVSIQTTKGEPNPNASILSRAIVTVVVICFTFYYHLAGWCCCARNPHRRCARKLKSKSVLYVVQSEIAARIVKV